MSDINKINLDLDEVRANQLVSDFIEQLNDNFRKIENHITISSEEPSGTANNGDIWIMYGET